MRKFLLTLLAAASVAGATAPVAHADPYWDGPGYRGGRGYDGPVYVERRRDRGIGGDALAAGAIGLAAGALLGTALAAPRQAPPPPPPVYRAPYGRADYGTPSYGIAPPTYEDTVPARRYRPEPRAARYYDGGDHVDRCYARYRSYDERTDTFLGHDGYRRPCRL